jgi:hypothetical protein
VIIGCHRRLAAERDSIRWNAAIGTGGWLVSGAVSTNIEMELTQVAERVEPVKPGEPAKMEA